LRISAAIERTEDEEDLTLVVQVAPGRRIRLPYRSEGAFLNPALAGEATCAPTRRIP
jgi:hypothetical protein